MVWFRSRRTDRSRAPTFLPSTPCALDAYQKQIEDDHALAVVLANIQPGDPAGRMFSKLTPTHVVALNSASAATPGPSMLDSLGVPVSVQANIATIAGAGDGDEDEVQFVGDPMYGNSTAAAAIFTPDTFAVTPETTGRRMQQLPGQNAAMASRTGGHLGGPASWQTSASGVTVANGRSGAAAAVPFSPQETQAYLETQMMTPVSPWNPAGAAAASAFTPLRAQAYGHDRGQPTPPMSVPGREDKRRAASQVEKLTKLARDVATNPRLVETDKAELLAFAQKFKLKCFMLIKKSTPSHEDQEVIESLLTFDQASLTLLKFLAVDLALDVPQVLEEMATPDTSVEVSSPEASSTSRESGRSKRKRAHK